MSDNAASNALSAIESPIPSRSLTVDRSADFINASLRYHIKEFENLKNELETYSGPNQEELIEIRKSVWRTWGHSPDINKPGFVNLIDKQVQSASEPNFFRSNKYYERFYLHSIPIILLSHVLLEAYINAIVAVGLLTSEKADLLEVYDKMDLKSKWLLGPQLFVEKMSIERGNEKFGRLARLIRMRNTITHYKPKIEFRGKIANKDRRQLIPSIDAQGARDVLAFSTLPDELSLYIFSLITDGELRWALKAVIPQHLKLEI